jgi:protein phosphatase
VADLCAALSDAGLKRRVNEDCCGMDPARGMYVVADGLGAHAAGRRASETGVAALLRWDPTLASETPLAALRRAVRAANREIHALAASDPRLRGMGTTLAVLWVWQRHACWAHVGDSRIYRVRDGRLAALTLDHSLAADGVAARRRRPCRGQRHIVTRALGVQPEVEPDTAQLRVRPGDLFALCTDGISAALPEPELAQILCSAPADLAVTARALVDAANARGGEDNATVVLVRTG